jgi:hypothetical protein
MKLILLNGLNSLILVDEFCVKFVGHVKNCQSFMSRVRFGYIDT